MGLWIVLGIVAALVVIIVAIYNGLVLKPALDREGSSGITVQFRRRADLFPT